MMRHVLTILLIVAAIGGVMKFLNFAKKSAAEGENRDAVQRYAPGKLPGLPAELEASLAAAQQEGAAGLRRWLYQHRTEISEPRLTEIELDYVVLVGRNSAAEARSVLNLIKPRLKPDHPLYKRFQQLDKAYP
jgi:hypothetical protein